MHKTIDEAMVGLAEWKNNRKDVVESLSKSIAYKPTFEAGYLSEAILYRFIELAESTYELYKSNFLIGAVVTARSAHETLAVLWYLNIKLEHLVNTKNIDHFTETMKRLLMGWTKDEQFPERVNVLTMVDSVDKSLQLGFRRNYDMLSEYAHPNYSGTFGAYAKYEDHFKVSFGCYPRNKYILEKHIENTLIICVSMLDFIQEKLELNYFAALDVCIELQEQGKVKEAYNKVAE